MNGFAIIRGGILDHLLASTISFFDLGIYVTIHLQANFQTGVWRGSAPRLLAAAPRGTDLRQVQRALQNLAKVGFLRSFHVRGQRGNFAVLINRYDVKLGALKGRRLIAAKSDDWRHPFYESCAEDVADSDAENDAESDAESDAEGAPSSGVRSQNSGIRNKAQAQNQPSPSAFAGIYLAVAQRQDALLASAFPWADRAAEYRKADSWLEANPERRPKNSRRFLHNWFAKIPLPSNGKGGLSRAEERTRNNLRAAGFVA
jgi:hypothetical protein